MTQVLAATTGLFRDRDLFIHDGSKLRRFRVSAPLQAVLFIALLGLVGWFVANRVLGDRWLWLFFLNALSLYLLVPLIPLAVITPWLRQRRLWLGLAAGFGIGLYLYGGLWLPRPQAARQCQASPLTPP